MNRVLKPFGDFEVTKLAEQLYELAERNEQHLDERRYPLITDLYGQSPEDAEASVIRAQSQHRRLKVGHYAIMGSDYKDVIGSASILPHTPLRQLPSRGLLAVKLPYASPEVRAWVDVGEGNDGLDTLAEAYQELLVQSRLAAWKKANAVAWTIEPPQVPVNRAYHEALALAGLVEVDTRRYSNSGRSRTVAESTLYAALPGDWSGHSAKAKEKSLRKP